MPIWRDSQSQAFEAAVISSACSSTLRELDISQTITPSAADMHLKHLPQLESFAALIQPDSPAPQPWRIATPKSASLQALCIQKPGHMLDEQHAMLIDPSALAGAEELQC